MNKKLIYLLVLLTSSIVHAQKIKLYTFYTPSHKILKDKWFLPTLKDPDIDLIMRQFPQECRSGRVFSTGWKEAMLRKVDMILQAIMQNWGDIFIYSDIDVQFFGPIAKPIMHAIKGKDIVFQRDTPTGTICNGFFVCRANEYTRELWQEVREHMMNSNQRSDQKTMNLLLRKSKNKNKFKVIWDYLPVEFFGGGTLNASTWRSGKRLTVPKKIIVHHANWTVGISHKIAQLTYVRDKVAQRRRCFRIA